MVLSLLGMWFPQGARREGTAPWDNLRREHQTSKPSENCTHARAGFGARLIPTLLPFPSWRSRFPCSLFPWQLQAHWKGAISHPPSPSRGSVTNKVSMAVFSILSNSTGPCFFRGNSLRSDCPLPSIPSSGFSLRNRLREEFLQDARQAWPRLCPTPLDTICSWT